MTLTVVQNDGTVLECRFEAVTAGELVPGLLWSADGGMKPSPAVLTGHGRTSHKRRPWPLTASAEFPARYLGELSP